MHKLTNEFHVPGFINTRAVHDANMWLGKSRFANGTKSRAHCDGSDNLYVLLKGRKRLRMWAPHHAIYMDTFGAVHSIAPNGNVRLGGHKPIKDHGSLTEVLRSFWNLLTEPTRQGHFSRLNSDWVNPETNPEFKNAIAATVDLVEGDMLWLPAGWFHEVTSFDTHLALNFWVAPPSNGGDRPMPFS